MSLAKLGASRANGLLGMREYVKSQYLVGLPRERQHMANYTLDIIT